VRRALWLVLLVPGIALAVATVKHEVSGTNAGTISATVTGTRTVTFQDQTTTLVGRDTTDTLTNKTLDVEDTGNVVTRIQQQFIRAAGVFNTITYYDANGSTDQPGANTPAMSNNWPTLRQLVFDPATTEEVSFGLHLSSYASISDGVDVLLYWGPTTGSCGGSCGVRLCVKIACGTAGTNSLDLGAQQESSTCNIETASSTAVAMQVATFSAIDADGCAAGDLATLSVSRTGANIADQYSADSALYGVVLRWRSAE